MYLRGQEEQYWEREPACLHTVPSVQVPVGSFAVSIGGRKKEERKEASEPGSSIEAGGGTHESRSEAEILHSGEKRKERGVLVRNGGEGSREKLLFLFQPPFFPLPKSGRKRERDLDARFRYRGGGGISLIGRKRKRRRKGKKIRNFVVAISFFLPSQLPLRA